MSPDRSGWIARRQTGPETDGRCRRPPADARRGKRLSRPSSRACSGRTSMARSAVSIARLASFDMGCFDLLFFGRRGRTAARSTHQASELVAGTSVRRPPGRERKVVETAPRIDITLGLHGRPCAFGLVEGSSVTDWQVRGGLRVRQVAAEVDPAEQGGQTEAMLTMPSASTSIVPSCGSAWRHSSHLQRWRCCRAGPSRTGLRPRRRCRR